MINHQIEYVHGDVHTQGLRATGQSECEYRFNSRKLQTRSASRLQWLRFGAGSSGSVRLFSLRIPTLSLGKLLYGLLELLGAEAIFACHDTLASGQS
jgi:hypothetical protein